MQSVFGYHLVFSPLYPGVPGEGYGKAKEGKGDEQPDNPVQEAELLVEDITYPVD